jgi:hypothetical protein
VFDECAPKLAGANMTGEFKKKMLSTFFIVTVMVNADKTRTPIS